MGRLFLLRHGEPDFPNGEHMCLGRTELPLSSLGRKQASAVAREWADREFTLYSSPQIRCLETARAFGREIHVLDGLRERDMGVWDGLSFRQIRQQYPELYAARAENKNLLPPGAEALSEAKARFSEALARIRRECRSDAVVVTHSGVISLYLDIQKPVYCQVIEIE